MFLSQRFSILTQGKLDALLYYLINYQLNKPSDHAFDFAAFDKLRHHRHLNTSQIINPQS